MHVIVCYHNRQVKGSISIMLCAIYKSIRKHQTYLYIAKRDDFSAVPEALLTQFGVPQLVSLLKIEKNTKLAMANANNVLSAIINEGYYLQLPPPPVNYLREQKAWQKQQKGEHDEVN